MDKMNQEHIIKEKRKGSLPDGDPLKRVPNGTLHTLFESMEGTVQEKERILDFALRNTDINLWYFNCDTGECLQGENCQKAHEMPGDALMRNFPECLFEIGYVREDSIEPLRAAYRRLWETGESVEFDAWFRKADGSGWWCEHDMLTAITDSQGRVVRGIGVGKNVTAEKQLEKKYQEFQSYRTIAEKNTIASFRMNLTTGWFGDCLSENPIVLNTYPVGNIDDFFDTARKHIAVPEDLERCGAVFSRSYLLGIFGNGETSLSTEYRYRNHEGRAIWLRTDVEMMPNPETGDVEALLHTFDIDYEKNMQFMVDKLLTTDYEFMGLVDVATGYLMVFGDNKDVPGMARNGGNYDEEMTRVFGELILPEYFDEGVRTMSCSHVIKELENREIYTCSFPARDFIKSLAGRKQWKFGYLDDGKTQILMTRTDITDRYTAEYDELTGLYNRQAFYRHVREILDAHTAQRFVLLRCDIDRFKAYNDVHGAQAGDRLLAQFGKAVRRNTWPDTTIFGRIEADHFCAIYPKDKLDVDGWYTLHTNWLESSAMPGYRLTSSVGIYEITEPDIDVSLMCDRALLALRTVKDSYDRKIAWYDERLREKLMVEQTLADEMEHALAGEQFVLYYQPQINYVNGRIIGAEALVRWKHPKRGLIPPGEFIPIFEKNGFILKLDAYVWEKSCAYLRRQLDIGRSSIHLPISVNISRYDLYDPTLCSRLKGLVEKYQVPTSLLKLEITESAYMDDPGQLIDVVGELRKLGFIVEMDDFGTGYSSLNMLKDVPVDVLKLDMKFLPKWDNDQRGTTILSSVIQMAGNLGLPVIAEGVETKDQADYLHGLGCTHMQGYYFGRPMPEKEFEPLLVHGR